MASVYSGAGEGTRANVTVRGEIQFSLLYNYRLGALEVGVKRCRDLAAVDVKRNRSDPYVKVCIGNCYLLPSCKLPALPLAMRWFLRKRR